MKVHVALMGRGYHLAEGMPDHLELDKSATIADALRAMESRFADGHRLPASCLVAVSGEHLGTVSNHRDRSLRDGDEITLIAPVAGG